MALELFTFSGTPFGWRVQLVALIKNIPLDINWLAPSPEGIKSEEFLAINPRGKVPALRSDGFVVYESTAIADYLDALHPVPMIYGTGPEEKALIRQTIAEQECYLSLDVPAFAGTLFIGQAKAQWDLVANAAASVLAELDYYESRLADRDFIAIDSISATDLMLYPLVTVFFRASGHTDAAELEIAEKIPKRFPKLQAWQSRIETIPGFDSTIPPGYD